MMLSGSTEASPEVVREKEPPPSPLPRTPLPALCPSSLPSGMPSLTATQIVSRESSFPPCRTLQESMQEPFLLYGASGRLLGRCDPSDLWGLLISEHTTFNCTYRRTLVRVGRASSSDIVLSDPRVSSTHFSILLELELFGDECSPHSQEDRPATHQESNALVSEGSAVDSQASSCTSSPPSGNHNDVRRYKSENNSRSAAAPRHRCRVRRVLLTDCSSNGTYVNDVLVGHGEHRELRYGDDICVVRVSEKKRERPFSTLGASPARGSEDEEREKEVEDVTPQPHDALEHRPEESGGDSSEFSVPPAIQAPNWDVTRIETDGASTNLEGDAGARVTQLFSALLPSVSKEHTYVEHFCFHFYYAEEEVPQDAMKVDDPLAATTRMVEAKHKAVAMLDMEGVAGVPSASGPTKKFPQGTGAISAGSNSSTLPPQVFQGAEDEGGVWGPATKLVHFSRNPVIFCNAPLEEPALERLPVARLASQAMNVPRVRFPSAAVLPPPSPPARLQNSVVPMEASSSVMTPQSLLRSRRSIRESFIAPIAQPDQAVSLIPPFESSHGASVEALSLKDRTEVDTTSSHDNMAGSALVSSQRRNSVASVGSVSRSDHSNTMGSIMKDLPVDTPIRYAVLPLRHLQWGGRIGFGASGEVFMGIDISTATAVAIKVLKGASLFPADDAAASQEHHRMAKLAASPQTDTTLLTLTNLSLDCASSSIPPTAGKALPTMPFSTRSPPLSTGPPKDSSDPDSEREHIGLGQPLSLPAVSTPVEKGRSEEAKRMMNGAVRSALPASVIVTSSAASVRERTPDTNVPSGSASTPPAHPLQHSHQPPFEAYATSPVLRKHLREIIFLTTLQHHRIVRFLGFQFSEKGRLCLLMEYVAGGTLQTLVKNFGAFEENLIRLYTLQILEGMEYLARRGVVHGDLKSANILVSEQGNAKLTDFGTSRFISSCSDTKGGRGGEEAMPLGATAAAQRESVGKPQEKRPKRARHASCGTLVDGERRLSYRSTGPSSEDANTKVKSVEQHSCADEEGDDIKGSDGGGSDEEIREDYPGGMEDGANDDTEEAGVTEGQSEGATERGAVPHRLLCGTPLYMSPELIRTQEPSFASDMWALGCVVYEMATGGVLPWREVHHSNPAAVIWHIGQRTAENEGPSFGDVYLERAPLNHTNTPTRDAEEKIVPGDDAPSFWGTSHAENVQETPAHEWSRTPSPLLLDLLRSALHMNAAMRPTAAELLQHPFIRNEASYAALERWHATLSSNRQASMQALTKHAESDDGEGEALQAIKWFPQRLTPVSDGGRCRSRSPLAPVALAATGNSSVPSRERLPQARASSTAPEMLESLPLSRVEEVDEEEHNLDPSNGLGDDTLVHGFTPDRLSFSASADIAAKGSTGSPSRGSSGLSGKTSVASGGQGAVPDSKPQRTQGFAQPKPPELQRRNPAQSTSVLGAGEPDSQPLIYEPPPPPPPPAAPVLVMQQTLGTPSSSSLPSDANFPIQRSAVLSTSAPTQFPFHLSQFPAADAGAHAGGQVHAPLYATRTWQPHRKSNLQQHQLFLQQNELKRHRNSLSFQFDDRQIRGRRRTEGFPEPKGSPFSSHGVFTAPASPPSYQHAVRQPVLDRPLGYSSYNPQVNTQTVEMQLPMRFVRSHFAAGFQGERKNSSGRVAPSGEPHAAGRPQPFSQQMNTGKGKYGGRRDALHGAQLGMRGAKTFPHESNGSPLLLSSLQGYRGGASPSFDAATACPEPPPMLQPQRAMPPHLTAFSTRGLTAEMDNMTFASSAVVPGPPPPALCDTGLASFPPQSAFASVYPGDAAPLHTPFSQLQQQRYERGPLRMPTSLHALPSAMLPSMPASARNEFCSGEADAAERYSSPTAGTTRETLRFSRGSRTARASRPSRRIAKPVRGETGAKDGGRPVLRGFSKRSRKMKVVLPRALSAPQQRQINVASATSSNLRPCAAGGPQLPLHAPPPPTPQQLQQTEFVQKDVVQSKKSTSVAEGATDNKSASASQPQKKKWHFRSKSRLPRQTSLQRGEILKRLISSVGEGKKKEREACNR